MQTPHHIYPSKTRIILFIFFFGIFLVYALSVYFGYPELMNGIMSVIFALGIFGFILPCLIYLIWLSTRNEPILCIFENHICLRQTTIPFRTIELHIDQILEIRTNEAFDSDWQDLIFKVSPESFKSLSQSKVWRKTKNNELYFEFSQAELGCKQATEMLKNSLN